MYLMPFGVFDNLMEVNIVKKRWHLLGPNGRQLFMGTFKLCKHGEDERHLITIHKACKFNADRNKTN